MPEIFFALLVVLALFKPLGVYIADVMNGRETFLTPILVWLERGIYQMAGIQSEKEMRWMRYTLNIVLFSFFGFVVLYLIFLCQHFLPLNPQQYLGLRADTAFNAAISFLTNTNWQSYSGEKELSYFSQTAGITVQNFLSAAVGIAVAAALFRSIARRNSETIGNCWVDITRATVYVLLPLSLVFAVLFAAQGVVQSFAPYVHATGIEGKDLTIPQGPAASQVAIKLLGSNGGGFFNANAAHPFENPTPLTNVLQLIAVLLLPAALIYTLGVMVADRRQSWALLAAMLLLFIPLLALAVIQEDQANPLFPTNIEQSAGNMEGKEQRFGAASSAFWSTVTTATSNGATNSAHDSYMPLGGLPAMLLMQMGELVFGGVGSGVYGLFVFLILTVFIGGLMVGRTPEYLGKKIGPFEIKMASLAVVIPCVLALVGGAVAVMAPGGQAGVLNPGPQGFSEILYAVNSASNNNGSAFAGLNAATPFYNLLLGIVMLFGRFLLIIPILAIAGALAQKSYVPPTAGTLPTHTPLFVFLLCGVIVLVGILSYAPALALGPIAEHVRLFTAGT